MKRKIKKLTSESLDAETALTVSTDTAHAKPSESGKTLTIYEYEQKYTKRQNVRGAKMCLRLLCAVIGILLFICMFFFTLKIMDIYFYAGVGVGAVCLILYIVFFIVPIVKILRTGHFVTNVNAMTARAAQKHNRKLRHEIADKIIDLTSKVDGVGWYDSAVVGRLAIAMKTGDEKGISQGLTALYTGSVKQSAKDLILKYSMKSALYSVMSKTNKVDAVLVAFVNLQLIKDIVFLYGFRPSDTKLVKIFARVLQNSLVAYGLGSTQIGSNVVKTMGDVIKGIPFLGTAISALIDSSVQGLTNGVLTAVIGFQTIKYLSAEYKLQDILDGIELEKEDDLQETCAELERELKGRKSPAPSAA